MLCQRFKKVFVALIGNIRFRAMSYWDMMMEFHHYFDAVGRGTVVMGTSRPTTLSNKRVSRYRDIIEKIMLSQTRDDYN